MLKHYLSIISLLCLAVGGASAQQNVLPELKAASRKAPRDAQAQRAYGRALIRAKRLKEAEHQMKRVVRLEKESMESLYDLATVKFAEGHYKRSRAACRALVLQDGEHPLSHVCMARAYLVWRRASMAIEPLEAALAVEPNHVRALVALGDARRMQSSMEPAQKAYDKALAADPSSAQACLGLGRLYLLKGQPELAAQKLQDAMNRDGGDPEILFELGRIKGGAEGVRLLRKALEGRPTWGQAKLALAEALLQAGELDEAEAIYRDRLKKQKRDATATAGLGRILLSKGAYAEAEPVLKQAADLMPADQHTALALAELYEKTDRHEDAFSEYRRAATIRQQDSAPFIAAARLGLRLSRPLLAGAFLQRALERSPKSGEALGLYGDVLAARGDKQGAREYYSKALGGEGKYDSAEFQRKLSALK